MRIEMQLENTLLTAIWRWSKPYTYGKRAWWRIQDPAVNTTFRVGVIKKTWRGTAGPVTWAFTRRYVQAQDDPNDWASEANKAAVYGLRHL